MEPVIMVMALRLRTSNSYPPAPMAPGHVGGFVGVGRPQGILGVGVVAGAAASGAGAHATSTVLAPTAVAGGTHASATVVVPDNAAAYHQALHGYGLGLGLGGPGA